MGKGEESGGKLIDLWLEKKMIVGNKFFEKGIYKFIWVSGIHGHKSFLNLILVKMVIEIYFRMSLC